MVALGARLNWINQMEEETFLFNILPKGDFDLVHQNQYFGGWPVYQKQANGIVMAFPVEGWQASAAVALWQGEDGRIFGKAFCGAGLAERAWRQALACLSLDIDGGLWPEVGTRDAVIGTLQQKYRFLRPILFHSPYEAAAGFVIGHRITIKQKEVIMRRMAQDLGETIDIDTDGQKVHAFPSSQAILALTEYKSLSGLKLERLHGVARAALDGTLDREYLRSLPTDEAIAKLKTLPGIGAFFAQGILHRGAGIVDDVTSDDLTQYAIQKAYQLGELPDQTHMLEIAKNWRPFRMWAIILLHIWLRREVGLPQKRTFVKH